MKKLVKEVTVVEKHMCDLCGKELPKDQYTVDGKNEYHNKCYIEVVKK